MMSANIMKSIAKFGIIGNALQYFHYFLPLVTKCYLFDNNLNYVKLYNNNLINNFVKCNRNPNKKECHEKITVYFFSHVCSCC